MNGEQKKKLTEMVAIIGQAIDGVAEVKSDHEAAYDEMGDDQQTEPDGEELQGIIQYLDDAETALSNAIGAIKEVI